MFPMQCFFGTACETCTLWSHWLWPHNRFFLVPRSLEPEPRIVSTQPIPRLRVFILLEQARTMTQFMSIYLCTPCTLRNSLRYTWATGARLQSSLAQLLDGYRSKDGPTRIKIACKGQGMRTRGLTRNNAPWRDANFHKRTHGGDKVLRTPANVAGGVGDAGRKPALLGIASW